MRRMLINAQNPEEMRVAVIDGTTLENFQIEVAEQGLTRSNIYRAMVTNLQPSLNAAFVDYGEARDGFLPFHDVVPQAWHRQPAKGKRARTESLLERGKPMIVQVVKDPEGQKGGALTTNVSLAGRYLVFTPFDDTRGVSRKVEDDELRRKLKQQIEKLDLPAGGGYIVRTNALEQTKASLQRDFNGLMRIWKKIETEARNGKGPKLLYGDQDLVARVLRDYLDATVEEILIDDDAAFETAKEFVSAFMPRGKTRVERYSERLPLFSRFDIESQIERIFDRTVPLASGGSIVIDRTEALIAIDVNSGRSTRGSNQEATAVNTNLEAAAEVARQLRLRDIGGLIVVDFIDMRSAENRALLEKTLREAMKSDKARSAIGRISQNGLLEINRQKIRQALHLRTHRPCPTCAGTGRIASPEMVGLNLLRRIQTRAAAGDLKKARIELHPELADAFQNSRRHEIAAIEREFGIQIEVIAATHLHRPEEHIEWIEGERKEVAAPKQEKPARPSRAETKVRPAPAEAAPVVAPPHNGEEAEPKRGRKRRRGRKKRRGEEGADVAHPPDAPPIVSPAVHEHEAPPPATKKRRGRRRGRKKGAATPAAAMPMEQ